MAKTYASNRTFWIDYLRSSLTVLVVAHHSSLAYTTFARFDKNAYINSTSPIVDTKRWVGLDLFQNFNDIFFMSLMFLIGGLFLSKSIVKKGAISFILDRSYRLFVPFLVLGTAFMLVAYFPSFYIAHSSTDLLAYIKDFFTVERWPVGPPWFIWVLFVFNLLFVFLNPFLQKAKPVINALITSAQNKPVQTFLIFTLISWALYVPLAHNVGAGTWIGVGPFDFQLSRIILYFGYFICGILIGNTDFNNTIFSQNSPFIKRWWLWTLLSLAVYVILIMGSKSLEQWVKDSRMNELTAWMIYYTIYVSSCTLSCLAFISVFKKHVHFQKKWWNSLSNNAYLIYLIHYIFVNWTQFLLLGYDIPAFAKFIITFMVALVLSWGASSLLRKNKLIRKYL